MIEANVETVMEAREKLSKKATREEGIGILKKLMEFAEAYQWRADVMSPCCGGSLDGFCSKYRTVEDALNDIINRLEKGDSVESIDPSLDMLQQQLACDIGVTSEMVKKIESGG